MVSGAAKPFSHVQTVEPCSDPFQRSHTIKFREPHSPYYFAELVTDPVAGRLPDRAEDIAMTAVSHGGQAALWLFQVANPEEYRSGRTAGELQNVLAERLVPGTSVVAVNGVRHWLRSLREVGLVQQEQRGRAVLHTSVEDQRSLAAIGLFRRLSKDYDDIGIVIPRVFGKPQADQAGRNSQLARVRYIRFVKNALTEGVNEIPLASLLSDVGCEYFHTTYARIMLSRIAATGLFELDQPSNQVGVTTRSGGASVRVNASNEQLDYMSELVRGLDAIAMGAVRFTERHTQVALESAQDRAKFTELYKDFVPAGNERVSSASELENRVRAVLTSDSNAGRQWTAAELAAAVADSSDSPDPEYALRGRVNIHPTTVRVILEPLVKAGIVTQKIAPRHGTFLYTWA